MKKSTVLFIVSFLAVVCLSSGKLSAENKNAPTLIEPIGYGNGVYYFPVDLYSIKNEHQGMHFARSLAGFIGKSRCKVRAMTANVDVPPSADLRTRTIGYIVVCE